MITAARKRGSNNMVIGAKVSDSHVNRKSGRGASGGKSARALALEAWSEWVMLTSRDDDEPSSKLIAKLTSAVKRGRRSDVKNLVSMATYVPPEGDRDDVKRLLGVLSSKIKREEAEMLASGSGSPILYSPGSAKITSDDLAEMMSTPSVADWSGDDIEAANQLRWMEKETIETMVRTARAVSGVHELFPSEVLRDGRKRIKNDNRPSGSGNSKDSGYDRGAIAAEKLSGELIQYDELAYEMLIDGVDENDVIKFHSKAPKGFWDDVVTATQDGTSLRDAYASLEEKYPDFDPLSENREAK